MKLFYKVFILVKPKIISETYYGALLPSVCCMKHLRSQLSSSKVISLYLDSLDINLEKELVAFKVILPVWLWSYNLDMFVGSDVILIKAICCNTCHYVIL